MERNGYIMKVRILGKTEASIGNGETITVSPGDYDLVGQEAMNAYFDVPTDDGKMLARVGPYSATWQIIYEEA